MDETPFPTTLMQAIRYFEDGGRCREFVAALRWPDGVACPREGCGGTEVQFIATRGIWRCKTCKRQFSVKVGTIFEDSPIGLDKWLTALWLITSSKKGISSYQLSRDLGVTQKTAWFMEHRLRLAMRMETFNKPLDGEVEADETFIGGKETNKHADKRLIKKHPSKRGGGTEGKAIVMGLLQRDGEFRAAVVPSTRKGHLQAQRAATFALRAERWKDATGHLSDVRAKIAHEDYRKIVEMGTPAVPLILADLRVNGGWWFAALEELTGQNPATDEERRKPRTMREAWLRWGAAAGYIID